MELDKEEMEENQDNKQNKDENDNYNDNDNDNDNEEEQDENSDNYNNASALSLLCQILAMFGSLNPSKFCPIIMEYAFENILASVQYHKKIS